MKGSIGFKSLYRCKKVGVNSMTYFFQVNGFKENLDISEQFYRWPFLKTAISSDLEWSPHSLRFKKIF